MLMYCSSRAVAGRRWVLSTHKNHPRSLSSSTSRTKATGYPQHVRAKNKSIQQKEQLCHFSTTASTTTTITAEYHTTRLSQVQHPDCPDQRKHEALIDFNKSMDDLCSKHMDLPAQEFALGCSFLHQVALGNFKLCQKFINDWPEITNFRDYDRRTPLHVAASEGHVDIAEYLIQNGALINRSDRWGGSPLDDAHRHKHLKVVELLKQHNAHFGSPSQASNFITAASEGDIDEVRALLEFGCVKEIIDDGDYDSRTALHVSAAGGMTEVVRLLCEAGANVNVRDRWGNRPLDDAADSNNEDCIELLKSFGAKHGSTTYHEDFVPNEDHDDDHALLDLMHRYGKVRNGELSMDWHDVHDMLTGVGENPTDLSVQKLFEVADVDGDGLITREEFLNHSDTFLAGRPARLILVVGGPGSGKGLLCERLVKETGVVHISSGDLLREEVAEGTPLGKQVEQIMKDGGLVSSAILVTLMQKRMQDHPGKRILLDGFPRSQENAKDLVTLCGKPE